ncbi:hypothetical protein GUJ93_ZPchr0009g1726 [Zizania palustris]|uniref:SHSP domain-containing protein n=1 Tax=Zizania palustris TaxID=103762 RepID=A0A8J5RRW7_ZIZPA|nr:hypothetical protein GUJ93_ZPchr0009g1726 [Zizania palustris]
MDLRSRVYEELDPAVEWKQVGDDQDVVEISLPGFRKEQVRVQVDNHGVLRATGERPPATRGGKWVRFKKDLRIPDNCDADAVRARFEDQKLTIVLPIIVADDDAAASPSLSPGFKTPPQSQPRTPPPASNEPLPRPPPVKDTVVQPKPPPPRPSPPPQTVVQVPPSQPPPPAAAPEPTKTATDMPTPSSPPKPRWELPKITLRVPGAQGAAGGVPPSRHWDDRAPATAPEPTKPATDKPKPSSPPKPRWELPKITLRVPGAQGAAGGVPPSRHWDDRAPATVPEPTKPATDKPKPSSPPKPRWELPKITLPLPVPGAQGATGGVPPSRHWDRAPATAPEPTKPATDNDKPKPPLTSVLWELPRITLPAAKAQAAADGEPKPPPPSLPYKAEPSSPPSPPRKEIAAAIPGRDIGAPTPPAPPPPQEKKDSEAPEEDDEVSRPSKRKHKKAREVAKVGAPPPETDKTAAAAREARELLVNMAAAAAVLIGITVAVWRTLSS